MLSRRIRVRLVTAAVVVLAMAMAGAGPAASGMPTVAAAGGGAGSASVEPSQCWTSDNGFPRLTGLTVSPARVDVRRSAAWVTVTARPVDEGGPGPATGIHELGVDLAGGLGSVTMAAQTDGTWTGRLRVPPGVKPGTYGVDGVRLRDGADRNFGHVRDYFRDQLVALGMGGDFQVVSKRDNRAPRLVTLTASATKIDVTAGPGSVRFQARVTDDIAGTGAVTVQTLAGRSVELTLRHGTRRDGTWAGAMRVARWSPTIPADTILVTLTDQPGNQRDLYSERLAERGLPSALVVTSRRADTAKPQLADVTLTPSTVNLTAADSAVTATVHATDRPAGMGGSFFVIRHLPRVAGNRYHGTWRKTVRLDRCLWRAGDVRLEVVMFDRANNRIAVKRTLTVVNDADVRAPFPRAVTPQEAGPSDPVTFRFNEEVVGVSASSAPVRRSAQGSQFGVGDPPPAVPGSWSCLSVSGAPVDCVTGPLLRATWTPAAPLTPGWDYAVDWNPEHVLDIRDLAGNPVDPGLRFEDEFAPTWRVTTS
jgi:hypothetical protein